MNAQPALSGTHPATPAATSTHPSAPLVSQQASVSANAAPQQLWVFSLSPANAGAELELTSLILAADQPGNSDAGSAQAKSTSHSLATRPPQARPAFLQYDPIRHGWIIVQI